MLSRGKTISKRPEAALRSVQKVKQLNANHRESSLDPEANVIVILEILVITMNLEIIEPASKKRAPEIYTLS